MSESLMRAQVGSMCFDKHKIYTSWAKTISIWDKTTGELADVVTVPPNDNLTKGVRLCVDDSNIYFTSIYFFHVMDKNTHKLRYQKRFGTDNSSDFDLGTILADQVRIYFSIRNGGIVVVDKADFEHPIYLNQHGGSVWTSTQDQSTLFTGGVDARILAVDKTTLSVSTCFSGHKGNIHSLYIHKDILVSASADDSIIVWNKKNGTVLHQIRKARCSLGRAIINDRHLLCVAKGAARIWDTGTWSLLKEAQVLGRMHVDIDANTLYFCDPKGAGVATAKLRDIINM